MAAGPSLRGTLARQLESVRPFCKVPAEAADGFSGERQHERSQGEWLAPVVVANTRFTLQRGAS